MRFLLVTILFCTGCAAGPEPGSLQYIMKQQEIQLAEACEDNFKVDPWKKTYYNVGGVLVDERNYCRAKARLLVNARPARTGSR